MCASGTMHGTEQKMTLLLRLVLLCSVVTGVVSYCGELCLRIIYMDERELEPVCNKTQKTRLNTLQRCVELQGEEVEQRGGGRVCFRSKLLIGTGNTFFELFWIEYIRRCYHKGVADAGQAPRVLMFMFVQPGAGNLIWDPFTWLKTIKCRYIDSYR